MSDESNTPPEQIPSQQDTGGAILRDVRIPFPETFLYANCAAFSISQNEIRLGFAEAMQDGRAVSKVGIVMPPETAAVIALTLLAQVHTFEAHFGEIRHPMWKAMKAGQDPSQFGVRPYAAPEPTPDSGQTPG